MPPTLSYEFRLDPAETVRAVNAAADRGWGAWARWAVWPVFAGLALLLRASGVPWREMGFLGASVGLLASVLVVMPRVQRRRLRRVFASSPMHAAPQRHEFGPAGVRITAGPAVTEFGWDAFTGAAETPEFFHLTLGAGITYFLPKRAVGGLAEQDRLRTLLRAHLGARAASIAGRAPAAG